MFNDRDQDLERLERELARVEQDGPPPVPRSEISAYNSDQCDDDLEEYSQEVLEGKDDRFRLSLIAIALSLTAAILAVVAWTVLRLKGAA